MDAKWIVTEIDGRVASVAADFRHFARIAAQVAALPPETVGTTRSTRRGSGSRMRRCAVTAQMFSIKDRVLSVSFGSAVVKSPADSIRDCVSRSDRDMYRNKKAKESWM